VDPVCQNYSNPILRRARRRSRRGEERAATSTPRPWRAGKPKSRAGPRVENSSRSACAAAATPRPKPPPTSPWVGRRYFMRRSWQGKADREVTTPPRQALVRQRRVRFSFGLGAPLAAQLVRLVGASLTEQQTAPAPAAWARDRGAGAAASARMLRQMRSLGAVRGARPPLRAPPGPSPRGPSWRRVARRVRRRRRPAGARAGTVHLGQVGGCSSSASTACSRAPAPTRPSPDSSRSRPRSPIQGSMSAPSRMLLGFRFLCTPFFSWMYASPHATPRDGAIRSQPATPPG
jgi:hypothetical protein